MDGNPTTTARRGTLLWAAVATIALVMGGSVLQATSAAARPQPGDWRTPAGGHSTSGPAAEAVADHAFVDPQIDARVRAVAVQEDGGIVVGGEFVSVGGQPRLRVARLEDDGTLDDTFVDPGVDGTVTAIAVEPDGQVLIGGEFLTVDGEARQRVARLEGDGTLDDTFVDPGVNGTVRSIAVEPDGQILIGGSFTSVDGQPRLRVARLEDDGALDDTFVDPEADGTVHSIALQGDGRVLIGGEFTSVDGESRQRVARLEDDGALDATFVDPEVNGVVRSLALWINAGVAIGGDFTSVDGQSRQRVARLGSDGALDLTFGDPGVDADVRGLATIDNQVVIGGSFGVVDGHTRHGVARLGPFGAIDISIRDPRPDAAVDAVALQDDGAIIAAGDFTTVDFDTHQRVTRVLPASTAPAGTVDLRVQGNPTGGDDYARAVALQTDGKIVIAGEIGGLGGQFGVARYRANGTLDPTFSGNGWTTTNFSAGYDEAMDLVIQPNGRIVVAGYTDRGVVALARYLPGGALDASFSGDGKVLSDLSPGFAWATGVGLQPDGRIVVAGETGGQGGQFMVARYQANGTLDPTFSGNGWAAANLSAGEDWAWDMALQPDGKIVAAGAARGQVGSTNRTMAIVRWLPSGALDASFSGDGKRLAEFGPQAEIATSVAIQSDGAIVAGGGVGLNRAEGFAVARFTATGGIDPTFSGDGWAVLQLTTAGDFVWDVALQPNGRIVLAGIGGARGGEMALVRYRPDGTLDGTMGTGTGRVGINFTPDFDGATGVAIQPDGRIVLAGGSDGAPGRLALARVVG